MMNDLKSIIMFVHLSGLALGLGGAWIVDIFIVKHLMHRPVTKEKYKFISFSANIVYIGLALLWASGLGFIVFYYFVTPELLYNQKVWAKVFIVMVLTANGALVHHYLLPKIKHCVGSPLLFVFPLKTSYVMMAVGTVSVVSWLFPVILGVFSSLNFSVSAYSIVGFYLASIIVGLIIGQFLMMFAIDENKPINIEERVVYMSKVFDYDVNKIRAVFLKKYKVNVSSSIICKVLYDNGLLNQAKRKKHLKVING